jgi:hypothetical protein
VDRSLVVTAFQPAGSLLNLVNPSFAVEMGGLALGRVGCHRWLRFTWPMLVMLLVLYAVTLSTGVFVSGPIFWYKETGFVPRFVARATKRCPKRPGFSTQIIEPIEGKV